MKDALQVLTVIMLVLVVVVGVPLGIWKWANSFPTTYCTDWTRAVSIEPTNSDNGKHSDEQYIVKYEDGSITGKDQGAISFARCTNKVKVHESQKQSHWKVVGDYSGVDWEQ